MALPLIWRLTLGYAAILLLSVCASIYAVVQLTELSQTAREALDTDYRTIGHQEALTDTFLSEVRYGGKYLLTQSPASLDQFRQFKNDFRRYLGQLKTAGATAETSTQLMRIEHLHQSFHELFEREASYLKANQPYAQSRYQQEREKLLDNTLRELALLKEQLDKNIHDKLERLGGTSHAARNIAIAATLLLLIIGAALSLKISTSVTQPLLELTNRSKQALANHNSGARLSNIPEIQDLADVLTRQKQQMAQATLNDAGQMERVTEELATRITSLNSRILELKTKQQNSMDPQGRRLMDTLSDDTDSLVQYCAELNASAAARMEVMKLSPQTAPVLNAELTTVGTNRWLMRELPAPDVTTESPVKPIAARCAEIFAPLVRQLKRDKNETETHDT